MTESELLDERKVLGVDEIVRRLPKFFTISVASKRNSGKSHLISQLVKLLLKQKKVDIVLVMSGSAGLNDDWNFLPAKLIMKFDESVLESIWTKQCKDKAEGKPLRHVLIVMDDCLSDINALRNQVVNRYFSLGRHIHSSFIVISQHSSVLLSPIIRGNSDILLWSRLGVLQLEQLWSSTTNISKKDFIRISEKLGGHDYNFMLLDNFNNTGDPMDFLTVVRAAP